MRLERLVIEAGEATFTLDLHRRLTVVAGIGAEERSSLVSELIGALGGSRTGVHLELEQRDGRHLAVFRPTAGAARIVDVDTARDISDELVDPSGGCDLLGRLGLDAPAATQVMLVSSGDLATSSDRGRTIETLAGLDQKRVWAAAEALLDAEGELVAEAAARGSLPADASLMELVETRHDAVLRATDQFEATRKRTILLAGVAAVATVPGVIYGGPTGLAFLAVAGLAAAASWLARGRLQRAAHEEERALLDAGAQTYLGFQLQRVNRLLGDDNSRRTLMDAASHRRSALAEWQQLAGDLPVEWALANRDEISEVARRVRQADALSSVGASGSEGPQVVDDRAESLAHSLITRLAEARSVGGEGLPLVLDDALHELPSDTKLHLLELLGRSAGDPQVVLLTEDPDVVRWARLEATAGTMALIEPTAPASATEDISITL